MPSLMDLEAFLMVMILAKLNYREICQVRKVCRNLRNFIDTVKPEFFMKKMFVHLNTDSVKIGLQDLEARDPEPRDPKSRDPRHIEYRKQGAQCLIITEWSEHSKRQTIQNSEYMEIFCGDFQLLLSHLKTTVLESFEVVAPEVPKKLQKVFESKKVSLKAQVFEVKTSNQGEVMKVLPFLDAACLDEIVMTKSGISKEIWNIEKIVETEQWKKTKVLHLKLFFGRTSITEYCHFRKADFELDSISTKDLIQMKEALSNPRTLEHIFVGYHNDSIDMETLQKAFGRPYIQNDESKGLQRHWFWKIPDFDKILHLTLELSRFIFNHVESIPVGADFS